MAQYILTEAARKYGLDNLPVDPATAAANMSTLGTITSAKSSWMEDYLPLGQPIVFTYQYANGFTQVMSMKATGATTANISSNVYTRASTGEILANMLMDQTVDFFNVGSTFTMETMFGGNDIITGNSANNKLKGYAGSDRIDGGAGVDTAYYDGYASQYKVTTSSSGITVNGPEGIDTLVNMERIRFADKSVAYDSSGNGGQAYRLYQAAFNRTPDKSGLGFQMNALDTGLALTQVAQNFINSPEFKATYGSLNDTQFVSQLYANVLHRAPDAGGLDYHVKNLAGGTSRAQTLVGFSESPENQAALIGVIQNGMEYTTTV